MTSKKNAELLFCLSLLLLPLFFGCREQPSDYPARQVPQEIMTDAAHLNAGLQLFRSKCVACHGKSSEGRSERAAFFQPPASDFTEARYQKIDPAYLYWRIEQGKTIEPFRSQGSVMPAWGEHFNEEQIWQIIVYLKTRTH